MIGILSRRPGLEPASAPESLSSVDSFECGCTIWPNLVFPSGTWPARPGTGGARVR